MSWQQMVRNTGSDSSIVSDTGDCDVGNMKQISNLRLLAASALLLVVTAVTWAVADSVSADGAQPGIYSKTTSELMLEHIVIRVDDLRQAIDDYELLGFTVTPGGEHQGGISHNALIHFEDKTFIELVAFEKTFLTTLALNTGLLAFFLDNESDHIKYRFIETMNFPEGFIDSALLSHAIEADTQLARQRGLTTAQITPFERRKPNGDLVHWDIMSPLSAALPFLRSPYVPEQIIKPAQMTHNNGVIGLINISYAVATLKASQTQYEALLGTPALISNPEGNPVASFTLGTATIHLLPIDEHTELASFVRERRDIPVQLTLRTRFTERAGSLPFKLTHGAEIILEPASAPTTH